MEINQTIPDTFAPAVEAVPTCVYRVYDARDSLLYVGLSDDPERRWKEHRKQKEWWRPEVACIRVQWFPDRDAAADEEVHLIKTEKPRHNVREHREGTGSKAGERVRPVKVLTRKPVPRHAPTPDDGRDLRIHIHALASRKGITMKVLADRIGMHPNNLSRLANGHFTKLRMTTLAALCRELGCTVDDLLTFE